MMMKANFDKSCCGSKGGRTASGAIISVGKSAIKVFIISACFAPLRTLPPKTRILRSALGRNNEGLFVD